MHIVGDEIALFDSSKLLKKMSFDKNVVINMNMHEHVFDYCFQNLGINQAIQNPVVLTETLCNPNASRSLTSELLFECYGVPAISYTVDSLSGYFYNSF